MAGGSGNLLADTDEGKQFARKIYEAWQSFAPDVITGIEVRKYFLTLYVDRKVSTIAANDLEFLATQSVRAAQREYDSAGATLLIIQDDVPIMEVRYNGFTRSTRITKYE